MEIETPVLLAYAIEDSTDIFRISGGVFEHPKPPLSVRHCMFRALSAHLQEDAIVYMQYMVLSLSTRVSGGLSVHSVTTNSRRELQYRMLHVYKCIPLKMST